MGKLGGSGEQKSLDELNAAFYLCWRMKLLETLWAVIWAEWRISGTGRAVRWQGHGIVDPKAEWWFTVVTAASQIFNFVKTQWLELIIVIIIKRWKSTQNSSSSCFLVRKLQSFMLLWAPP